MESSPKQRLIHCKDDAEEFSGKLVTFFLPYDRNEADISRRISLFYKDEDRRHHLESGQMKNEWGWKSPLDMTTYTGLKENEQVIHCWIFVYKRDGILLPYSDKMSDAGSSDNSLHSLDGNVCMRLEPKVNVFYISYRKAQWFRSRLLRLENFHSFACQNRRIICYLPRYASCYGRKLMTTNCTILPVSWSRCSGTEQVKYLVFLVILCYITLYLSTASV